MLQKLYFYAQGWKTTIHQKSIEIRVVFFERIKATISSCRKNFWCFCLIIYETLRVTTFPWKRLRKLFKLFGVRVLRGIINYNVHLEYCLFSSWIYLLSFLLILSKRRNTFLREEQRVLCKAQSRLPDYPFVIV